MSAQYQKLSNFNGDPYFCRSCEGFGAHFGNSQLGYKYVMEKMSGDLNFYHFLLLSYQNIQDGG